MANLEIGSQFKHGEKTVTVIGKLEDGTISGRRISPHRHATLKMAMSQASRTLGNEDELKRRIEEEGGWHDVVQAVGRQISKQLPVSIREELENGLHDVIVTGTSSHVDSQPFTRKFKTNKGIEYSVTCPFAKISTSWLKLKARINPRTFK